MLSTPEPPGGQLDTRASVNRNLMQDSQLDLVQVPTWSRTH
jgi:hypothetical protein